MLFILFLIIGCIICLILLYVYSDINYFSQNLQVCLYHSAVRLCVFMYYSDIDNTLENMANYRKNKWIIEGKLRK